ncbi:nicotinate-nucleotide--dimethylbenzimidazole phosphoribosyltransferase [Dyadobacter psychrotolerans]|uniref:Nicotinate-nucleotide--dimethylbenzimidazole phosphoribosyltransferase n=1 Tax=Dyadobacter psychrotolerans TaxID=2541721 RepID=A0A4R5DQE1_9BACT|nr:nicotinate-nucleotide--dimethylbenzimidazole phosphoribosyltransferase [Dyadobacter psychrotolerans]TDE16489.1 nicotinate-nucleotide--dimethylbenzimidazole phosphoribosyltransferase [Dyadobacter psychrotolerans]
MQSSLSKEIQHKIDHKTKPVGALGKLEKLAFQVASVQNTLTPELTKPHIIIFAASHGIASSGVSAYPSEVTPQMVLNFINGGAAINVFTKQHGINLWLVDAGVDYDFDQNERLIHAKISHGTRNFLKEAAMTKEECENCLLKGAELVRKVQDTGCNVIGFGEMGIGNTSSASLIMSKLLNIPLEDCVGKGSGLNDAQVIHKMSVLNKALEKHSDVDDDPLKVLQTFGGYEIAMMCGAMLEAAKLKMIVLVDGFIASVSFLCALKMNSSVQDYAVFCHQSNEKGHQLLVQKLGVDPVLKMDMRLGEGTGCALAYPILQSAVFFFTEMASFESAGVSQKAEL